MQDFKVLFYLMAQFENSLLPNDAIKPLCWIFYFYNHNLAFLLLNP